MAAPIRVSALLEIPGVDPVIRLHSKVDGAGGDAGLRGLGDDGRYQLVRHLEVQDGTEKRR